MSRYRFLLINAFSLAPGSDFQMRSFSGPKETQVYNYEDLKPFLADIDWDLHPGARATHGNWPVTTKEAFMSVGNNRLPLVREACAGGRYNAIVLLGGGDPGYMEAREISRQYRIPVTTSAHSPGFTTSFGARSTQPTRRCVDSSRRPRRSAAAMSTPSTRRCCAARASRFTRVSARHSSSSGMR